MKKNNTARNVVAFPKQAKPMAQKGETTYIRVAMPIEILEYLIEDSRDNRRTVPQQVAAIVKSFYFGADSCGPIDASELEFVPGGKITRPATCETRHQQLNTFLRVIEGGKK